MTPQQLHDVFSRLRAANPSPRTELVYASPFELLVSVILLFPPWVKGRIELRRKTKALQEAEVDLERLRHSLEKLTGRTAPPVPGDVPLRESSDE